MEMGILTIVALIFWALALAGVEWIAQLISWLFANALIVGLILLIIHICFSAATIRRAYIDYSTKGAFCAIIQAAFPPMIITACYYASLEAVEAQTSIISFSFNWILVFFCMTGIWYLGNLALDTETHPKSNLRLIGFTILNVLLSIQLIGMVTYSGF